MSVLYLVDYFHLFPHSVSCLFTFMMLSFEAQFLIFDVQFYIFFSSVTYAFGVILKKIYPFFCNSFAIFGS